MEYYLRSRPALASVSLSLPQYLMLKMMMCNFTNRWEASLYSKRRSRRTATLQIEITITWANSGLS
ncbi:unnamed protein product [Hymenolepis diminuta]|uniref:Uncharacterized protein n=1 Tax=Hymenolepis diminuta TaxID=6216 RepID=A0A564YAH7_HYMDI|nr:unnamed protein product [Hymenolepis diminuta]